MLKELRETLRDRRTIATLVLMPLLVYPLLSVAFERFLLSSMKAIPGHSEPVLGFVSDAEAQDFTQYLLRGNSILGRRRRRQKTRRTRCEARLAPP